MRASLATSEGEDLASFSRVIGHTSSKGCVQFSCLFTEVPGRLAFSEVCHRLGEVASCLWWKGSTRLRSLERARKEVV
jgi:hypothetical protein